MLHYLMYMWHTRVLRQGSLKFCLLQSKFELQQVQRFTESKLQGSVWKSPETPTPKRKRKLGSIDGEGTLMAIFR